MNNMQPVATDATLNLLLGLFWGIIALLAGYSTFAAFTGSIMMHGGLFATATAGATVLSFLSFRKTKRIRQLNHLSNQEMTQSITDPQTAESEQPS